MVNSEKRPKNEEVLATSEYLNAFRLGSDYQALLETVAAEWNITRHEASKRLVLMALGGFCVEQNEALVGLSQVFEDRQQPFAAAVRAARNHIYKQAGRRGSDLSACIQELTEKTVMTAQTA